MDQRDENVLVTLTERYAPSLLPMWDKRGTFDDRLPRLARGLASYNILVLRADEPYSLQNIHQNMGALIQEWANHYAEFYRRLCQDLFPSFNQVSIHGTDNRWPVIVYLQGTATPVIQRMAGFIAPYIVERQFSPTISEVELVGLMDLVLDELEAGNLAREAYKQLRNDCVEILKQMLETPVQQLAVTEFDREIFSDSRRFVPVQIEPPSSIPETPPSKLPPHIPPVRQADTEQLMPTDIMPTAPKQLDDPTTTSDQPKDNAGFSLANTFAGLRRDKDSGRKPRPPIPPLPNTDRKE
jgi:hypothetical protein